MRFTELYTYRNADDFICSDFVLINIGDSDDAIQKLGYLEDIEEGLGIDLFKLSKALKIIKSIGILRPYETSGGQCWLETMCDATKLTKEEYKLLKEVLL